MLRLNTSAPGFDQAFDTIVRDRREGGADVAVEQRADARQVVGEGGDDHLEGAAGAAEETRLVEAGIGPVDRPDAAGERGVFLGREAFQGLAVAVGQPEDVVGGLRRRLGRLERVGAPLLEPGALAEHVPQAKPKEDRQHGEEEDIEERKVHPGLRSALAVVIL